MFVSKRRFILKTCGTTLLLQALVPLLELAREYCGFDAIEVRHDNTVFLVIALSIFLIFVFRLLLLLVVFFFFQYIGYPIYGARNNLETA